MKYKLFFIAMAIAIISSMINQTVFAADINLKLGIVTPTKHPHSITAKKFSELVDQKTNGKVSIKVFDNGTLGSNPELLDGVKTGIFDFTIIPPSVMAEYSSIIGILELPYIFIDKQHMMTVTRGPVGTSITATYLKKTGIEILGYCGGAQRNMITTKKAINSIADLKGLKMRTWEWNVMLDWWKSLGAEGVVVPFSEVYTSLQTSNIDGAENEFASFTTARWAEVAKNIALTQHSITVRPLIGNAKKIAQLPTDIQQSIRAAALEAADFDVKLESKQDEENKAKLATNYGISYTTPDRSPLIAASAKIIKQFAKDNVITELADKIKAAAK